MRTLIVDDERMARKRLRTLLAGEPDVEVVADVGNGRDAVRAIREQRPELVFLDVQMPEMDGFAVVREVGVEQMPVTVFVTAYDQYALEAFRAHALDYLLKPFDRERFGHTLRRALEQVRLRTAGKLGETVMELLGRESVAGTREPGSRSASSSRRAVPPPASRASSPDSRILVRSAGRVIFLRADEIDWIEAAGNYVRLHVGKETHLLHESLGALVERLDPARFLRIHRSTVVNVDRVREMQPWFHGDAVIILRDGTRLSASRSYRERLLEALGGAQ